MIDLPEGVWIWEATPEKVKELWEKLQPFDALFGDDSMRDEGTFMAQFLDSPSVVLETDGGILYLTRILPNLRAEAHFSFWDHKLSARTWLIKDCLSWGFLEFNLERIETFVASYARQVQHFLKKRLGFTFEGTMRNRVRHDGKLIDIEVYGILRREVLL